MTKHKKEDDEVIETVTTKKVTRKRAKKKSTKKKTTRKKSTRKKAKKKTTRKRAKKKSPSTKTSSVKLETEKLLIENFVILQRVLADMSSKFEGLSEQMSKLLSLFELSAKTFAEKPGASKENQEFMNKLDQLMEQNKIIAKGLSLMGERGAQRSGGYMESSSPSPPPNYNPNPQGMPRKRPIQGM